MNNPFITIVIPTYNSEGTIVRCIDSIVHQTFKQWEILIIDNVSSDNTISIIRSYSDNRILVFSESDNGVYDAMNKGIRRAHGEWIYFLGSDDYLHNNNVFHDVISHIPKRCDVFYGDVDAPQLEERHKGEWQINDLDYNRCHQAIFYNRNFFNKYGLYNLKYKVCADFDMNLKWMLSKTIKSFYYPILIANYSDGGYSSMVPDDIFAFDFPLLVLRYGWNTMKKKDRKKYNILAKQRLQFYVKRTKDHLFGFLKTNRFHC